MKTTLLILLVALCLARPAEASGPPEIYITTTETGIRYRLMDYNRRTEKEAKTLDEVGAWSVDRLKDDPGYLFFVTPDDRTSFKILMDVLRCLKAAGVKQFAANAVEAKAGVQVTHYLHGKMDMIGSTRESPAPAAK
jgi:hypothetical protein